MENTEYKILHTMGAFFVRGDVINEKVVLEWFTKGGLKQMIKAGWIEEIQESEEKDRTYQIRLSEKEAELTSEKFKFLEKYDNRGIMVEAWYTKKIAEIQLFLETVAPYLRDDPAIEAFINWKTRKE